jgi:hypothetical protein
VPELGELLQTCRRSAFRLETRQRYSVPDEAEWLAAYLQDGSLPDLTDNPWIKLVTRKARAGAHMCRVHLVQPPPSSYLRFEFALQVTSLAAGEDVRVVDLLEHPELAGLTTDFWLFDEQTVIVMDYDADGRVVGRSLAHDPTPYVLHRDRALAVSIPLNRYLAAIGT